MNSIVAKIKWIMLVSGVLTCTMIYAAPRRKPRYAPRSERLWRVPVAPCVVIRLVPNKPLRPTAARACGSLVASRLGDG